MNEEKKSVSKDDKLLGALSYVSFVSIVMFLMKKDNEFVAHNSRQGIVLFVGSLFWVVLPPIGTAIAVASYVMMVIGFMKAYAGEWYDMPLVSVIAKKIS